MKKAEAESAAARADVERLKGDVQAKQASHYEVLCRMERMEAKLEASEASVQLANDEAQRLREEQQAAKDVIAALQRENARLETKLEETEASSGSEDALTLSDEEELVGTDEPPPALAPTAVAPAAAGVTRDSFGEWPQPMGGGITNYNHFGIHFKDVVAQIATLLYGEEVATDRIRSTRGKCFANGWGMLL
jgi:septal ring factor EnvC (AmiA/AmiB activator)